MRNRFRLHMTCVSGWASHPVPVAHDFRFWLRMTSGSGCASHPVPVAHYFRHRLRITYGSGCADISGFGFAVNYGRGFTVTSGSWCVVGKTRSAAKNAVSVFTSVSIPQINNGSR